MSSTKTLGSAEAPAVVLLRLGGSVVDVLGVLHVNGRPIAVTLELGWDNNARGVSCIPLGVYRCAATVSQRHGATWEVLGVPGRSGILFHAGNAASDSRGCILLGAALGETRAGGARTVVGSRIARDRFRSTLEGVRDFWLSVERLPDAGAVIDAMVGRAL